MRPTIELPRDPALPGLAPIREAGLGGAIAALGLAGFPVELRLCGHTPGSRATFEARAGDRRFAVKVYAEDPVPEAELYQALAAAALAPSRPGTELGGNSVVRVPPLVAWERELRLLVIGWLEGPTALDLVRGGQGRRAGELAGRWLERAASLPVRLGRPCGAPHMLYQTGRAVGALGAADRALKSAAKGVARMLAASVPVENAPRLVHGTLYARHILDVGNGPGVIDWQRFGDGPLELDAGTFLASISRSALDDEPLAGEVARAEDALLTATRGLLDERALAWHWAAALVRFASKVLKVDRRPDDWRARVRAQLDEATRLAGRAARRDSVARVEAPVFGLGGAALDLVLQALSTRPATPEELDQIRKLLAVARERTP